MGSTVAGSATRRLFGEAGALGQVLYLEAEALAGSEGPTRATGIGCYSAARRL
jgi:hypothetical protein